jgi:hypothetical protein
VEKWLGNKERVSRSEVAGKCLRAPLVRANTSMPLMVIMSFIKCSNIAEICIIII